MATKIIEIKRDGVFVSRGTLHYAGSPHAYTTIQEMLIPRMNDDWERGQLDAAVRVAIDAMCRAGRNRCEIFGHFFEWEVVG